MFTMILTTGCGDESANPATADNVTADSSGTGSAFFSINWHTDSDDPNPVSALVRQAIGNCTTAGVTSITCEVYDQSNNPIASGGPWSCEAREGRVERIPVGLNRTFAVLGWDSPGGSIVYRGQTTSSIAINPGEIADAGTIDAHPFVPTGLEAATISDSRIDLAWDDLDVAGYHVYRDGVMIATTVSPAYSDTNLSADTQYCYTVSSLDVFNNESGKSDEACATTGPSDDDVDNDGDGYSEIQGDCDDANANVNPEATEVCNGIDDNCAGGIDEGLSTDADGDGHYTLDSCLTPNDDCDDTRDSVYPGATEICGDAIDQDCNGADLSCDDVDNDGDGYSESAGDCDDANANVYPGATEVCNGIDDNCAGGIDEGLSTDADRDGHYTPGSCLTPADDCDDSDPARFPGNAEICDNNDNNCNDVVDEGLIRSTTCGVGACAGNTGTETCTAGRWGNDTCDPDAGATSEVCDNVDNDCDGAVDENLTRSTTCGVGACAGNTGTETCTAGRWGNDTCDPDAGATLEVCDNVDNDCDGSVDEGVQNTYYSDSDRDGFGDPNRTTEACSAPSGYVSNSEDCNDNNKFINPEADEICNDRTDNDCDDLTDLEDEECQCTYTVTIGDNDGYGYGASRVPDNADLPVSSQGNWIFENREPSEMNATDGSEHTDHEPSEQRDFTFTITFCPADRQTFNYATFTLDVSGIQESLWGTSTLRLDGRNYSQYLNQEQDIYGSDVITIDIEDVSLFTDGELTVRFIGGSSDAIGFDYFSLDTDN